MVGAQVCFYAAQMLLALEAIHSRDIVYRDLKPENLLLDRDGYIRLTDFGLSKEGVSSGDSGAETFCGTAEYLAPELLGSPGKSGGGRKSKKVPHGRAVDIWSLGVLMYEMIHGLPPFYDTDTRRMYDKILHAELQFSTFFSDDACDLISRMLERDPRRRMTVTEAKSHRFFVRPPAFLPRSSSLRFVDIKFLRFASSLPIYLVADNVVFCTAGFSGVEKDAAEGLQAADGAAARPRARPLLLRPDVHCRAAVRFPNPTIACCFWMEEEETLPMGPQPSALDPPASGSWKPTMRFLSDITRLPSQPRKHWCLSHD